MIFVSTGGERNKTACQSAEEYYLEDIAHVELSGGAFSPTCAADLKSLQERTGMQLQVHNYFPPPEKPFVFNLASGDPLNAERSIEHVRLAMRQAVAVKRPIYSFHAGFRINPAVSELGTKLRQRNLLARDSALNQFGERVAMLAEEARQIGVSLLIENNVINKANLAVFGEDPLLFTEPKEIDSFMSNVPSNVGLLLDVAHLKVSASTLGFDMDDAHETLRPWIKGYHLSDNDGSQDSNDPVTNDSWFWERLVRGLDYYTLEVYRMPAAGLAQQQKLVERKLNEPTLGDKENKV
ncbi:sugar phosphate isomerase/epimerase [Pseudomonadales bacterium]|nr:sugar phosphate isomerase/epimerase [Pseudomonadales bacterium]